MEYEFWDKIVFSGDRLYAGPQWVKTKIAMLDFMEPGVRLPCGSVRHVMHVPVSKTDLWTHPTINYYIYKDVSSTRERSVKEVG